MFLIGIKDILYLLLEQILFAIDMIQISDANYIQLSLAGFEAQYSFIIAVGKFE